MMGKFIIARHHESEWNKLGLWTGKRDRHLTSYGFEKSEEMGEFIKDIPIDYSFASMQVRSIETLSCMLNKCSKYDVPTEHLAALNERDYGDYTGKNKWDMEKILGKEGWENIRRGWDVSIPNGESLKMVYERIVPCFLEKMLPLLREGKNVLLVAHGNSLRALMKYIESISDQDILNVEMLFGAVVIYNLDEDGHMLSKEVKQVNQDSIMKHQKAQIIATIGPASSKKSILTEIIESGANVMRLNFSWGNLEVKGDEIVSIRSCEDKFGRSIPIIADIPGPRVQHDSSHSFDPSFGSCITEQDREYIKFAVENGLDYVAVSFVANAEDIRQCKEIIRSCNGNQKIIAKIERKEALENLKEIISEADAVMVARGDLGKNVPIEQIPFIQSEVIKLANQAGKPVIVATEMLLSMVSSKSPTRAEVNDVAEAIMEGADAVMLSEETAKGEFPVEAVAMMDKIVSEAEKHLNTQKGFNNILKLS